MVPATTLPRHLTPAPWQKALHAALAARLPGHLVPSRVREVAGAPARTMLPPASR